ncbi:hypothetical protein JHK82_025456 [Glycine max]|nr:hypothetical protein JHK85_026078 [Glycine max]KAG5134268.1 hypothetical protein JHK82_025456 [Glycine max]
MDLGVGSWNGRGIGSYGNYLWSDKEQNTRDNHKVGPHEGDEQGGTTLSTSPLEKHSTREIESCDINTWGPWPLALVRSNQVPKTKGTLQFKINFIGLIPSPPADMSLCDEVHGLGALVFFFVGWETLIKGDYEVELLEVQLRILLGELSCLAMDPTVLPINKCFCGSLVASISGELHLPL